MIEPYNKRFITDSVSIYIKFGAYTITYNSEDVSMEILFSEKEMDKIIEFVNKVKINEMS